VIEILEKRILDEIVTEIDDGGKEPISAADHVIEKPQLEVKLMDKDLIYLIKCLNLRKPKEGTWMAAVYAFVFALTMFELAKIIVGLSQIFEFIGLLSIVAGMVLLVSPLLGGGKLEQMEEAIMTFNYELLKMKKDGQ